MLQLVVCLWFYFALFCSFDIRQYAAQAVTSVTWKESAYIHLRFTSLLEKQTLASFLLQAGMLLLHSLSVFSVLVQQPGHILQVMSPAPPGDVEVDSSLNVSWEKRGGRRSS